MTRATHQGCGVGSEGGVRRIVTSRRDEFMNVHVTRARGNSRRHAVRTLIKDHHGHCAATTLTIGGHGVIRDAHLGFAAIRYQHRSVTARFGEDATGDVGRVWQSTHRPASDRVLRMLTFETRTLGQPCDTAAT